MAEVSKMPPRDIKPQLAPSLHDNHMPISTINSKPSPPEKKAEDLRSPIHEEQEDETASETANEPITPIDPHNTHDFHDTSNEILPENSQTDGPQTPLQPVNYSSKSPLLLDTSTTTPVESKTESETPTSTVTNKSPQIPSQSRNTTSNPPRPGVKRGLSGFFRRSNSNMNSNSTESGAITQGTGGSDTMPSGGGRPLPNRGTSARTSPTTTRSSSPPSPGSPTKDGTPLAPAHTAGEVPQSSQFLNGKTKNQSSTGLKIRNRIHGITFAASSGPKRPMGLRHRSTSMDMKDAPQDTTPSVQAELTRNPYAIGPGAGTGLKARRMSVNLPDDFTVDVVDLYSEFSNQSKIIGRRGKTLGKGATSTVALMVRKGFGSELYAVKEFRGKQTTEKEEDYEKKIKSEFSIAKSLHHPSIVETISLCTDSGKWNHVMEYCGEGDLYNVVQRGYLKVNVQNPEKDRKSDRHCLFKQLIQGIQYLHSHGIAHRDIKLENLLMTKDSKLKITDFGVSEVFSGIHPGLRAAGGECGKDMAEVRLCEPGICGSMPYIAPEVVLKKGNYDPRPLDVWSSAIVMIHLIFGGAIWPEAKDGQGHKHYDALLKGWSKWDSKHPDGDSFTEEDYPYVDAFDKMVSPPALRRLLVRMLHPDPSRRSTVEDVASNRWLKNVECCQLNNYDDPAVTIDASKKKHCTSSSAKASKIVLHDHLPPKTHKGHNLIRLPGSTDM